MIYYITVVLSRILFNLLFKKVVVRNEETFKKLKEKTGFILAPNHISNFDPVFVGAYAPPKIHFLAKKELFQNFFLGWGLRQLNALPINRAVPEKSILKHIIALLKEKEAVLVFPEGTRSKDGNLKEAKAGICMMASKAKVPILPCFVCGTNQKNGFFSRPTLTLTFGDPVYLDEFFAKAKLSKDDYRLMGEKIMSGIADAKQL